MNEFIKRILTTIALVPISIALISLASTWLFNAILCLLVVLIFTVEWPRLFAYNRFWFWISAPSYLLFPFFCIAKLHELSRILTLFLFITVIAHDIGSYSIGKLFGKRYIYPSISPGKTWEGFFGGYLTTLIVTVSFFSFFKLPVPLTLVASLTLGISTIALLGDLFESYLKRKARIKDSGTLLPGHGGLLDRFDALMFVAVFFYFFSEYLVKIL